jgi:hypothetical protein
LDGIIAPKFVTSKDIPVEIYEGWMNIIGNSQGLFDFIKQFHLLTV